MSQAPQFKFAVSGNTVRLFDTSSAQILDSIPAGTWELNIPMMGAPYLSSVENFDVPARTYGDVNERADIILHTYKDRLADGGRPRSTGVLLGGEPGSGKTLLAKVVAKRAREEFGWPTLIVNQAIDGSILQDWIARRSSPIVVIFDEFEKTYSDVNDQNSLLTIMDGLSNGNALFIFCVNNAEAMSGPFHNRPSRIFYRWRYVGLTEREIREYAEDQLVDKSKVDQLVTATSRYPTLNFDGLAAMVEELNRYGDTSIETVLKRMNISSIGTVYYRIGVRLGGDHPFVNARLSELAPHSSYRAIRIDYNNDGLDTTYNFDATMGVYVDADTGELLPGDGTVKPIGSAGNEETGHYAEQLLHNNMRQYDEDGEPKRPTDETGRPYATRRVGIDEYLNLNNMYPADASRELPRGSLVGRFKIDSLLGKNGYLELTMIPESNN